MKKICRILLMTVLTFSLSLQSRAQTETEASKTPLELGQLYAQSAVLMDADSGRILFEKNGYEKRPMASTTKIMTLIVTLENANLDEIVTVSEYAAGMPDVQLGIRAGEQYRLEDLLNGNLDEVIDGVGSQLIGVVPEDPEVTLFSSFGRMPDPKGELQRICKAVCQRLDGQYVPLMIH